MSGAGPDGTPAVRGWAEREREITQRVRTRVIAVAGFGVYIGGALAVAIGTAPGDSDIAGLEPGAVREFVYPMLAVIATLNVALVVRTGVFRRRSDIYSLVVWRRTIFGSMVCVAFASLVLTTLSWGQVDDKNWVTAIALSVAALLSAVLASAAPEEPNITDRRVVEYLGSREQFHNERIAEWERRTDTTVAELTEGGWLTSPAEGSATCRRLWWRAGAVAASVAAAGAAAGCVLALALSVSPARGAGAWALGAVSMWATIVWVAWACANVRKRTRRWACAATSVIGVVSPGGLFGGPFVGWGFLTVMSASAVAILLGAVWMFRGTRGWLSWWLWFPAWLFALNDARRRRATTQRLAEEAQQRLDEDDASRQEEQSEILALTREVSQLRAIVQRDSLARTRERWRR